MVDSIWRWPLWYGWLITVDTDPRRRLLITANGKSPADGGRLRKSTARYDCLANLALLGLLNEFC